MARPTLTVLMPAYNSARFLRRAVDSVLQQDWMDLELIVVNDGSSDETEEILLSYTDPRLKYVRNDVNRGLVYTLNRGLELASGEWIARMDADDICLPGRFSAQLAYFREHPEADVVATRVRLIDEQDQEIGYWEDDRRTVTPGEIRRYLPRNNCIAHPTVMVRSALIRTFRYRSSQSQAEDYDLWLRMAAAHKQIHKLETEYVLHRIVASSFTRNRQQNVFRKLAETKRRFLKESRGMGYDSTFLLAVWGQAQLDEIKSWLKDLKNKHVVQVTVV